MASWISARFRYQKQEMDASSLTRISVTPPIYWRPNSHAASCTWSTPVTGHTLHTNVLTPCNPSHGCAHARAHVPFRSSAPHSSRDRQPSSTSTHHSPVPHAHIQLASRMRPCPPASCRSALHCTLSRSWQSCVVCLVIRIMGMLLLHDL